MTVRQLLDNLDSRELVEWQAYYRVTNAINKKDKPLPPLDESLKNNLTGYKKVNTMKVT